MTSVSLAVALNDELSAVRYFVKELLGQGTFGQVVRCIRQDVQEAVAVKVIKNQTAFYHQVGQLKNFTCFTSFALS